MRWSGRLSHGRPSVSLPEAGVHLIRNSRNGRALLGSTANLASLRNKMALERATDTPGALDLRLRGDIREFGDLAVLEKLWREKLDPATLY